MQITVLDGYTLNPGDLSWNRLMDFGTVTLYDRTPEDRIVERAKGADILLTNKTPLTADILSQLPQLAYIGVLATGYNIVDVNAAVQRGIVVTNIPAYGTNSVSQAVFALLLSLCHHAEAHSQAVHRGAWVQNPDFCFWNHPLIELAGKTMGMIGFGRIGRQVANIASAFGMNILAADCQRGNAPDLPNFMWEDVEGLLARSDVVTLHCPLLPETRGMINRDTLALMKRTAFLINTSRGPLVVDEDLAEALNSERIAGAGLDVLSLEPPKQDNPLLSARNCLITPHIAWATFEARSRLMEIAVENVRAFMSGRPVNVVKG